MEKSPLTETESLLLPIYARLLTAAPMPPKKTKTKNWRSRPRTMENPYDLIPTLDPAIIARVREGMKRSTTVSDEPNEYQGDNELELEPPKSVSPAGRHVRFQSPLESPPVWQKQRQRVDDDVETGPDEISPAETDDSEDAMDDVAIEVGGISWPAEAFLPTISSDAPAFRRQSEPPEDGRAQAQEVLNNDDRLQRIETRLSAIEGHQEKLTAIQCTQQETKAILLSLCRNQGISSPSRRHTLFGGIASTSTCHIDPMVSSRFFLTGSPLTPRTVGNDQVVPGFEEASQNRNEEEMRRLLVNSIDTALKYAEDVQAELLAIDGRLEKTIMGLQGVQAMIQTLCIH